MYYEATDPGYRERATGWVTVIGLQDVVKESGLTTNEASVVRAILHNLKISSGDLAKILKVTPRQTQLIMAVLKSKADLKRRGGRSFGEWYF